MRNAKRTAAWLLALLLLFAAAPAARTGAFFQQGDLNNDLRVTAADAAVLLRALRDPGNMGMETLERADVTQSGTVNKVDARVILHMAAGNIPDLVAFVSRVSTGLCAETEFERFRYTGARWDGHNYYDDSVSITVTQHEFSNAICYVADVYVQDIARLRTAFSSGRHGGKLQYTDRIAASVDARIAVNGDFYSAQRKGPIVRNGVWYRTAIDKQTDIAVLTWGGELHTFRAGTLSLATLLALNPYQTWVFGPRLLDANGNAFANISGRLRGKNPRTAIGYYAPGHYCLVVVDGRQRQYSMGLTFTDLSAFMASIGCTAAYNLDGGQTSMMASADAVINMPYRDGRVVSDIIYVAP